MDGMDPEILNIEPDFSEKIEAPKLAIQILFDALVASMDFGSGFLDTEEVSALRAIAEVLGLPPEEGTPGGFIARFPHVFKASMMQHAVTLNAYPDGWREVDACKVGDWNARCGKPKSDPIHH